MQKNIESLSPKDFIIIKGAEVHNLKSIDLAIPRGQLIVFTGLSGSGKSSLAFDTLYAEGQRRYVESLSSYARQFLGRIDKPKVEYIKGISPAIAIEQKVSSTNPRSTVGTLSEIYDYIKLLFARIGKTYSPISGKEVKKDSVTDIINILKQKAEGTRFQIFVKVEKRSDRTTEQALSVLQGQGYSRVRIAGKSIRIDQAIEDKKALESDTFELIVDRFVLNYDEDTLARLADSLSTAFYQGYGTAYIEFIDSEKPEILEFSSKFEADGIKFEEPSLNLFSFNNPLGACPTCEGYGKIMGIDPELVIPNTALSVYQDAVAPWRGDKMSKWKQDLIDVAQKVDFPIHKPYFELSKEQKQMLWNGVKGKFRGINDFFDMLESDKTKIYYRIMLSKYRGKTICPTCEGTRLRKEAGYVKINDKSLPQLVDIPIKELYSFFERLELSDYQKEVAERILLEIQSRLSFLLDVGLSYLTLNRQANTLSGGESQRINLATSLGSSLVGSMYILDEPSIGLHQRDTERLISILKRLRDKGNTVIVVEHDEDVMRSADFLVDIGPLAGIKGGQVVFADKADKIDSADTLTAKYLRGEEKIEIPLRLRPVRNYVKVLGARENNLKNIDVVFPLDMLTVVTGVSGSGKSTLLKKILYPALSHKLDLTSEKPGQHSELIMDNSSIASVEMVDQNPIGKSSRSNPVTYIKAYDDIRELFAKQNLSKIRAFTSKHFSFNTDGGRCDVCKGEGELTVEMQFMADVHLPCEACGGKRFKKEVLEVLYEGKSIYDILQMSVDEAIEFFSLHKQNKIVEKIKALQDVGLGYVSLGQSSSTLSGGEAQRIKLASFLGKGKVNNKTLFIFDEPTTGLHFHDIKKLIVSFNALIEKGHSIIVIEHNPDVIKCADYVIELGPEGGEKGGEVVFSGTPRELAGCKESYTSKYLAEKFDK